LYCNYNCIPWFSNFNCCSNETCSEQVVNDKFFLYILLCYFRSDMVEKILFSWNDYVQYIEFRNCIISKYSYYLHDKLYGNHLHNTQLFINDWNIMKPTLPLSESNSRNLCSTRVSGSQIMLHKALGFRQWSRDFMDIPT